MAADKHSQRNTVYGDAIEAQIGDVSGGQLAVGKDITQIRAGRDVFSAETINIIYQSAKVAPDTVREDLSSTLCAHLLEGFLNRLDTEDLPLETRTFVVDEGLQVIYYQGDRLDAPDVRPSDIKELKDQIRSDLEAYRQSKHKSELDPRNEFKKNTLLTRAGLLRQYIEQARSILHTALTLFRQDAEAQVETPVQESLPPGQSLPDHPYKFLDYFEEKDSVIFFGRKPETRDLCADVAAHRLTVLYAKSGTGKTSLIRAGIIPRLKQEGYLTVYVRILQNPLIDLKQAINNRLQQPVEIVQDVTLQNFLKKVAERDTRPLVLIFDQFEEFFIRFSSPVREAFIGQLARVYTANLPVNFVISMREDFLGELNEVEVYLPSVFNNRFRLQPLTDKQAKEAIEGPVKLFGISYQDDLLNQMLSDLSQEGIEPPQLQIVCDTLWHQLQDGKDLITLEMYQQAGGARQILAGYVGEVLEEFAREQRKEQLKAARTILKEMVSSQQTKRLIDLKKIQERLATKFPPELVKQVLQRLINRRLIRSIERNDMLYYELAHEYLIETIRGWFDEEEVELKKAQEMLERALADYAYSGSLLSRGHIKIVERHREQLSWSSTAERLLQQSKKRSRRISTAVISLAVVLLSLVSIAGYQYFSKRLDDFHKHYDMGIFPAVSNSGNAELSLYRTKNGQSVEEKGFKGKEKFLQAGDYYLTATKGTKTLKYPIYIQGYPKRAKEVEVSISKDLSIPEGMVYIPSGWFRRGDKEFAGEPDEKTAHDVDLDAFLIDQYEVTNKEYAEFVDTGGYQEQSFWTEEGWIWLKLQEKLDEAIGQSPQATLWNHETLNGPDDPIAGVNWYEAYAYCKWAGKQLPTEAQWEKAARGPEGYRYVYGNTYAPMKTDTGEANSYGLYFMGGGVREWVLDQYDANYYEELSQKSDEERKNPVRPEEKAVFKLSNRTLRNLGSELIGMSDDLVEQLKSLEGREFTEAIDFLKVVASQIGPDATDKYQVFILGYALQEKTRVVRGDSSFVAEDESNTRTSFRDKFQPSQHHRRRGIRGFRCVKNISN